MAEPKDISVVWDEPATRPTIPVTGAYGGPSPDGCSVVAHLYVEYGTIPAMEELQRGESGRVKVRESSRIRRGDITRMLQATLVLSPEAAIRVGKWLVEKGQLATEGRKENQP